jgi:hypothetical protein
VSLFNAFHDPCPLRGIVNGLVCFCARLFAALLLFAFVALSGSRVCQTAVGINLSVGAFFSDDNLVLANH